MAKILVLGQSGSGKSTSIGAIPDLGIKGLNPTETFVIACASRALPFAGWMVKYQRAKVKFQPGSNTVIDIAPEGNYFQTNNPAAVANLISLISTKRDDIKNIVLDDLNYLMQDYYMDKAVAGGYDVFKKIGLFMGKIFKAIQNVPFEKNLIALAHYEEFKSKNNDRISFRFKTVGNMVQSYITPEGKFDYVLFTTQEYDDQAKTVDKFFITNFDGEFPAKSGHGVFPSLRIKNDLGLVLDHINAYNNGVVIEE